MNKLAFKERMKSLKSYRELNPDKGYWEWKQEVPTMQYAGVVNDPLIKEYIAKTDAVLPYRPQIVESVKRTLQPEEQLVTIHGNKFFVKDNTPQLSADTRTNYQKILDKGRGVILKKQYEELKKTEEVLKLLSVLATIASPSTYVGPVFKNNDKTYTENLLSGEGFGDKTSNLVFDMASPIVATKIISKHNAAKTIEEAFKIRRGANYTTKIPLQTEIMHIPKKLSYPDGSFAFFERPNKLTRLELDGYPKHYRNLSRNSNLFGTNFGNYDLKTNQHESDIFIDILGEGSEQTVFSSKNPNYVYKVYTGSTFDKTKLKDWVNKFLFRNKIDYAEPISYKGFVTSKLGVHPVFRQKRLQPIEWNDPNRISIQNQIRKMYKDVGFDENMIKDGIQLNDMQILNFAYDLNGNLKAIDVDVYPINGFKSSGQTTSYKDGGEINDGKNNAAIGGYTEEYWPKQSRLATYYDLDPTTRFSPEALLVDNQASGEENEYWKAYLGLDNMVPAMNKNAHTEWDEQIEKEKIENGELPSDFYGTTPSMDLSLQAAADTLMLGKINRNYDEYKAKYHNLPGKKTIQTIYETAKNVMNNPGKWQLMDGEYIIKKKNPEYDNEVNPLGMLAEYGMKWDPQTKTLYVHDTYDFPWYARAAGSIKTRPKEMKIRSAIKFDPKKGSVLLRTPENYNEAYLYQDGGEVNPYSRVNPYTGKPLSSSTIDPVLSLLNFSLSKNKKKKKDVKRDKKRKIKNKQSN